jgi:hypothetical protein
LRSIGVRKGLETKDTMSSQCNKPKFRGDKLVYNSNWPIKPNITIPTAIVHVEQQLKIKKEASLLPLFKNHLRNLSKLRDWSVYEERNTFRPKLKILVGEEELEWQVWVMKRNNNWRRNW